MPGFPVKTEAPEVKLSNLPVLQSGIKSLRQHVLKGQWVGGTKPTVTGPFT